MQIQGWRAWYADGQVWDSHTVKPYDLPVQGLQIVILYFIGEYAPGKVYREMLSGGDYIVWNGQQWQVTMDRPECPTCRVFPGSWMDDDAFYVLTQRALGAEVL